MSRVEHWRWWDQEITDIKGGNGSDGGGGVRYGGATGGGGPRQDIVDGAK